MGSRWTDSEPILLKTGSEKIARINTTTNRFCKICEKGSEKKKKRPQLWEHELILHQDNEAADPVLFAKAAFGLVMHCSA